MAVSGDQHNQMPFKDGFIRSVMKQIKKLFAYALFSSKYKCVILQSYDEMSLTSFPIHIADNTSAPEVPYGAIFAFHAA